MLAPEHSAVKKGNVYPRLDLSIDYRDPKHVRIRAYDEDHKVVDTLGANDVAEACLLAGMTIRYGETMYARKLRASAKPPRAQRRRPPVALRFLDALTLQLRRQKAAGAAEAVHRAASLQFHPQNWRAEQEPPQVLAVAEFALRYWAIEGLRQLRGERDTMLVAARRVSVTTTAVQCSGSSRCGCTGEAAGCVAEATRRGPWAKFRDKKWRRAGSR